MIKIQFGNTRLATQPQLSESVDSNRQHHEFSFSARTLSASMV
jgi:hypothetical protein